MRKSNLNQFFNFASLLVCCALFTACPSKKPDLSEETDLPKKEALNEALIVAETTNTSAHCKGPEVHKITRPAFPDKKQSETSHFNYSFRLRKSKLEGVPTIIYMSGGPGDPTIGNGTLPWMDKFNYVFTDLRGSGCNEFKSEDLPDDALRTEYAATDIVAIIDYLKDTQTSGIQLGSYFVHGASYGTVLATVVGSQIEASSRPLPSGIILEGTMGKNREYSEKYHQDLIKGYLDAISARLPDVVKKEFESSPSPYGILMKDWNMFAMGCLYGGSVLTEYDHSTKIAKWKHLLEYYLDTPPNQKRTDEIKKMILSFEGIIDPILQSRVYRIISCHELNLNPSICRDIVLDRPYDSAKIQLKAPVYYFQGEMDPATLLEEARYHYDNQKFTSKYFITFKGGGHTILQVELASIMDVLFQSIADGGEKFEFHLDYFKQIGAPITLEKK